MSDADPPEDFNDPIAALTCVNAATQRYTRALDACALAKAEVKAARYACSRMQQRFDHLRATMQMTAPHGTFWQSNGLMPEDD